MDPSAGAPRPVLTGAYAGQRIALATMHGKEAAIRPVLARRTGAAVALASGIDTDTLGTFTGEVERTASMGETAQAKARLGMQASGLPLGLASEGSFGPHPAVPLLPAGIEVLVLVDDQRGIVVGESLIDRQPCYGQAWTAPGGTAGDEVMRFLERVDFPRHALTVQPAEPRQEKAVVTKGIRDLATLTAAARRAAQASEDGRALVATDMRAHMNPTRMASIARLTFRLAERLEQHCPACDSPGFGQTQTVTGLPCRWCGAPTTLALGSTRACVACDASEFRPRPDGLVKAEPDWCPQCNP